ARYPQFDRQRALRRACYRAKQQADFFVETGNAEAASANLEFWNIHATAVMRARRVLGKYMRRILP
ncbi:MAG TPA: hypothetical protein VH255_05850, partial [Verrucomicrobiae bacterium]|nr:hypothetical protein [Verrucomicrobiae bacterium]